MIRQLEVLVIMVAITIHLIKDIQANLVKVIIGNHLYKKQLEMLKERIVKKTNMDYF